MADARHAPLYSIPECARYLGLPASTLRCWVAAGPAGDAAGTQPPVFPAGTQPIALSFTNLAELHTLAALLRNDKRPWPEVRKELARLYGAEQGSHPLAREEFAKANPGARLEYDAAGFAKRFYPPVPGEADSRVVVIDPAISFGRPVIAGTGVRTAVVASRVNAGESLCDVADDYLLQPCQVKDALRYELAA